MGINKGMAAAAVTIGDGVSIPEEVDNLIVTAIDVLNKNGLPIGYLLQVAPSFRRPVQAIRHISRADAGRKMAIIPGLEDVAISVVGFGLFPIDKETGHLLNRLAGGEYDIIHSISSIKKGMRIGLYCEHPATPDRAGTFWFEDCWITSWDPGRVNIAQVNDVTIVQSCDMEVTNTGWEFQTA